MTRAPLCIKQSNLLNSHQIIIQRHPLSFLHLCLQMVRHHFKWESPLFLSCSGEAMHWLYLPSQYEWQLWWLRGLASTTDTPRPPMVVLWGIRAVRHSNTRKDVHIFARMLHILVPFELNEIFCSEAVLLLVSDASFCFYSSTDDFLQLEQQ